MFNKQITNSDDFLDMPVSSQCLYFHLSMNADDEGFVNNWKSIMKLSGSKEDDVKVLIAKQYIIPFDSGVIVIKHWRLNNYLRSDRFTPTNHQKELANLVLDENMVYQTHTTCTPSIDKYSIEKNSIDNIEREINVKNNSNDYERCEYVTKSNERCARKSTYNINGKNYCNQHSKFIFPDDFKINKFVKPTVEEIQEYCIERKNGINANAFYDFYESKNWYVGKNKMKDWKACVRTWEQREKPKTKGWEDDFWNE